MTVSQIILIATVTCTALMAGLFFAYACSVVLGLRLLPDAGYIAAMQSINKTIQNPVFFLAFFGALILLPLCSYVHYTQLVSTRFGLLLSATLVYMIGVFGVTIAGNIPLNNTLEKFEPLNASTKAISAQRANFENRWNNLNLIRTIASAVSLVLAIMACVIPAETSGKL